MKIAPGIAIKFNVPQTITALSLGGENFYAKDGVIEIADELAKLYAVTLKHLGFLLLEEAPKLNEKIKPKAKPK